MLKGSFHILFVVIFLLQGMVYSLIQADFYLNRKEIATLFCINEDKPELHCNGKCELDRRLDQAQSQEEESEKIILPEFQLIYTLPLRSQYVNPCWKVFSPEFGIQNDFLFTALNSFDFFHPPQAW